MAKYAGEVRAYIRAIVAEREQARLVQALADLRRTCPPSGGAVEVAPLVTPAKTEPTP